MTNSWMTRIPVASECDDPVDDRRDVSPHGDDARIAVDRASLDSAAWTSFKIRHAAPMCLFAFAPTAEGAYSRMFAPDYGIAEDPATGSSTGPLASFMAQHGLAPSVSGGRFQSEQGTQMGRRSILHVQITGDGDSRVITVGGYVTPVIDGVITF
jgi:trans-2,3-dihydro-3-hydroxyanthranilate isomerase